MGRFKAFFVLLVAFIASCTACTGTLPHIHDSTEQTKQPKTIQALYEEALSAAALLEPGLIEAVWLISTNNPTIQTAQMGFASGRPHIVYVTKVMKDIQKRFGDAAVIAIFGHELHHIIDYANDYEFESPHARELSADTGAGCTVAVLGYSIKPYMNWLEKSTKETKSHPAPDKRIVAAMDGTQKCLAPWD